MSDDDRPVHDSQHARARKHAATPHFSGPPHLYRIDRPSGRQPLFLLLVTDNRGHLLSAAACDPEAYE